MDASGKTQQDGSILHAADDLVQARGPMRERPGASGPATPTLILKPVRPSEKKSAPDALGYRGGAGFGRGPLLPASSRLPPRPQLRRRQLLSGTGAP